MTIIGDSCDDFWSILTNVTIWCHTGKQIKEKKDNLKKERYSPSKKGKKKNDKVGEKQKVGKRRPEKPPCATKASNKIWWVSWSTQEYDIIAKHKKQDYIFLWLIWTDIQLLQCVESGECGAST